MDNAAIEEMFQALGPVTIKRMFGGKGIYVGDLIVALEVDGEILLKADEVTIPEFELSGCRQWTYEGRKGTPLKMPYWSIPDDAFDDPDLMADWVRLALEASLRASSLKR
ncbi:TfoX/Sxy family protein [Mycoplana dimorpha]|uniref:DNA transformation protein n=1 Tax=Mycoplana dimorpha TaxID=28320 RepID=A0A2T5AU25_MYCDI|nr:TfoX/Sxy family protein [Mycoplana dimorpha]PTM90217.1 DNA transformation protein [Mycoplana dimorpha]